MSQIADVGGGVAAPKRPAAKPGRATAAPRDMSDGELADEHRGQSFAKGRAQDRLAAIEAELERRGLQKATGKLAVVTRHATELGLLDLRRLRADHPALCRAYAQPGSQGFWRSATLPADQRPK